MVGPPPPLLLPSAMDQRDELVALSDDPFQMVAGVIVAGAVKADNPSLPVPSDHLHRRRLDVADDAVVSVADDLGGQRRSPSRAACISWIGQKDELKELLDAFQKYEKRLE